MASCWCAGPAILHDQYGWGSRRIDPLRSVIKNRWTSTPLFRFQSLDDLQLNLQTLCGAQDIVYGETEILDKTLGSRGTE